MSQSRASPPGVYENLGSINRYMEANVTLHTYMEETQVVLFAVCGSIAFSVLFCFYYKTSQSN